MADDVIELERPWHSLRDLAELLREDTHSILESLIHASTESWNTRPEIRERQVPVLERQHRGLAVGLQ